MIVKEVIKPLYVFKIFLCACVCAYLHFENFIYVVCFRLRVLPIFFLHLLHSSPQLYSFHKFLSSLSQVIVGHLGMCINPSTGGWVNYQGPHYRRKPTISPLAVSHQCQTPKLHHGTPCASYPSIIEFLAAEFYSGLFLSFLLLLFFEAGFFYVGQIVLELIL